MGTLVNSVSHWFNLTEVYLPCEYPCCLAWLHVRARGIRFSLADIPAMLIRLLNNVICLYFHLQLK